MIVMGGIVGSGIFINPYVVAQQVHTPVMILGAWIAGGVIALAYLPQIAARYKALFETNRPIVQAFLDSRQDLDCVKQRWGTVLFPRVKNGGVETPCRLVREKYETT